MKNNEIIIFENQNVKLEVTMQDETVWLTAEQMSALFNTTKRNIEMHIKNIYEEQELEKISTSKDFFQVQLESIRQIKRNKKMYNLDTIISIGYRIKSQNGIIFRRWKNKILKVIGSYSKALDLLDDYDHRTLKKPKGNINYKKIEYTNCIEVINNLKFGTNSNLFAVERDKGLESIIGNIYQSFGGADIYPSIEEKAANFLYLIVKNHVFVDVNKRIAAILFIYFLNFYNILYKNNQQIIDNNTLTALTLLIAESNPKEKNIIIGLVINFLS